MKVELLFFSSKSDEECMMCQNSNFNYSNLMLKIIIMYIICEENYLHCVINKNIGWNLTVVPICRSLKKVMLNKSVLLTHMLSLNYKLFS
jgi:hypothetical protein